MKSIALYSIKGGVGKTAACVNLAHLAAKTRGPALLCDLDPQGSSTFYYRIMPKTKYNSRNFLKGGKKIEKAIRATDFEELDLLPADLSYRHMDIQLSELPKSRSRLRRLFHELDDQYRTVLIDCPPNITLVSENVFEAADAILVPLIPTTLSLLTYRKLIDFFKKSGLDRKKFNPFSQWLNSGSRCIAGLFGKSWTAGSKFSTPLSPIALKSKRWVSTVRH